MAKIQLPPVIEEFNYRESLWHYKNQLEVHTCQGLRGQTYICTPSVLEPHGDVALDILDPESAL